MNYACEITYPVGESINGGIMMSVSQISGIGGTFLCDYFISNYPEKKWITNLKVFPSHHFRLQQKDCVVIVTSPHPYPAQVHMGRDNYQSFYSPMNKGSKRMARGILPVYLYLFAFDLQLDLKYVVLLLAMSDVAE